MTPGFLGTRASLLVDVTVLYFVVVPFLVYYAVRQAAAGGYDRHRKTQAGLLLLMVVAVLALEVAIRRGATAAISESAFAGTPWLNGLFAVHLGFSIPTFFIWAALGVRSWRGYARDLPGEFGPRHVWWGRVVFAGICVTSVTGAAVYVLGFAL